MNSKSDRLFWLLGGFFVANVLLAELIGSKIFSLERSLGLPAELEFSLLGQPLQGINLTAGVLMWPVVFVMTDIINEYFGRRGVRMLSFLAAGLVVYAFIMVYGAMWLAPAGFWATDPSTGLDRELAFDQVFGQGLWIITGSLAAFLVGQLTDVTAFHWLRRYTGARLIWLRATGSTLVSQLVDSFVVLFIAFYFSGRMSLPQVLAIALVNYAYKGLLALLLTPLLYLAHGAIDRYLGTEKAEKLIEQAARKG
ncbi:MAG: queuosine precursor transporter [Bacteroidetes bacterium]|jgi:uncharacterized integral membrane protein (TIGR00697 family)|nr:queuosine precursor transporter [Bacteroidota bacterium]